MAGQTLTVSGLWKIVIGFVFIAGTIISVSAYVSSIASRQELQHQEFNIFKAATEHALQTLQIQSEANRDSNERLTRSIDKVSILLDQLSKNLQK